MSDSDTGAFGAAPCAGDVQASVGEHAADCGTVYELSPQEARDPLSSLLQSDSVELVPTNEGGHEIAAAVDPRNPGLARFVRDEDTHPEGPRQTGSAVP